MLAAIGLRTSRSFALTISALRRCRWSEPGGERVSETRIGSLAHPGHISIGPDQHGCGRRNCAKDGKLPGTIVSHVDRADPVRPWRDVQGPGLAEIDEHRPGIVQQRECAQRTIWGNQIEIWHPPSAQRMSLAV